MHNQRSYIVSGLEDKVSQLENEKARLQNACREVEFKLLQANQNTQTLQQELEKSRTAIVQKQHDEKELLAKFNIELEDKEKLQQELHIYKKQVSNRSKFCLSKLYIYDRFTLSDCIAVI